LSLQPLTFSGGDMGKYVFAWILGVPAGVLVLAYIFFH
jgi:hypothetical protein